VLRVGDIGVIDPVEGLWRRQARRVRRQDRAHGSRIVDCAIRKTRS